MQPNPDEAVVNIIVDNVDAAAHERITELSSARLQSLSPVSSGQLTSNLSRPHSRDAYSKLPMSPRTIEEIKHTLSEQMESIDHQSGRYNNNGTKRNRLLGEHHSRVFKEDQSRLDNSQPRLVSKDLLSY